MTTTSVTGRAARLPRPREGDPDTGYRYLAPLLTEYAGCHPRSRHRRAVREQLIGGYLPVVRNIARRYGGRGESVDDLEQVGVIGLINALDRFDPERGSDFLSYLVPTVTGEIRRHFRDRTWSMRVPRRLKDLQQPVRRAVEQLSTGLQRAPRPSEIAAHLEVPLRDVLDALQARHAHTTESLDAPVGSGVDPPPPGVPGRVDAELDTVEYRDSLRAALHDLPERERTVIVMRFFGELTQTQIAERIGVSQMHVSRLLSQTLATLRSVLAAD